MSASSADAGAPQAGRFSGRNEFQQLVRGALARAAGEAWREIILCDASFEDWPLGERAVVESLQAWSRSGRRCTILACRFDEVSRRHARFVAWRRQWSHIVDCWACASANPQDFPSALWSPAWALVRVDAEHSTGLCSDDPARRLQLRELLGQWQRKSVPGFAVTTLGL
jgi:hypothetical protein